MTKTEKELIGMGFMALKKHCKSLDIKISLGVTKASMIKAILKKDPPPKVIKELTNEEKIKNKLTGNDNKDNDIDNFNKNNDDNDIISLSSHNTITLKEAISFVKRYSPRSGMFNSTIYPSFFNSFGVKEFRNLSIKQFINGLLNGNEKLLGTDNILTICALLETWHSSNQMDLLKDKLNGFIPTPKCIQKEKLMFSLFNIKNLLPKLRLFSKIIHLREEVLPLLIFMDNFNDSMTEIMNINTTNPNNKNDKQTESADIYQSIFLSSLTIAKFRNEDIVLNGYEKYKNIIDFLQKISLKPTAKEIFQSRRWNKLKKEGKLKNVLFKITSNVNSDQYANIIRSKAIKMGSAYQPPMARIIKDKNTKQQIRKEIGTKIDTKKLQNQLAKALNKHKSPSPNPNQNDNDDDNDKLNDNQLNDDDKKNDDNGLDDEPNDDMHGKYIKLESDGVFTKYTKMLSIGVGLDGVKQKMVMQGVKKEYIDLFVYYQKKYKSSSKPSSKPLKSSSNTNNIPSRPMSSALLNSINANRVPAGPSVPAPVPPPPPAAAIPVGIPIGAPPPVPPPVPPPFGATPARPMASRIPVKYKNVGLQWQKAVNKYRIISNKVDRLKLLINALDIQLYNQDLQQNDDDNDNKDNTDNSIPNNGLFYDNSFKYYLIKIQNIENCLNDWKKKSNLNALRMSELEVIYHKKFRPMILSQITSSRYQALIDGANKICYVPTEICGVIWMYVKPFDELIELKFSVDCINKFFDNDQKKIKIKKLPIQNHRGYETEYIL